MRVQIIIEDLTKEDIANLFTKANIGKCEISTPDEEYNEGYYADKLEAVDLGLHSGRKWANMNLGASRKDCCGLYFQWGETEGHEWGSDKEFTEESYKKVDASKLDGDLDLEHDAAHKMLGGGWHIPSADDFQELYDNCEWSWCNHRMMDGIQFTSKINGNFIFLPCSGYGNGSSWYNRGSYGLCWSSSLYSSTDGRNLYFGSGGVNPQDSNNRFYGFAVRPVL